MAVAAKSPNLEESFDMDSDWEDSLSSLSSVSYTKIFACSYVGCNKYFTKQARLQHHMYSHTGERPFKCTKDNCDASYRRAYHLRRHIQSAHEKGTFQCPKCPCKYMSEQALKKHDRVSHMDTNRFQCEECGMAFSKKNLLARHVSKIHLGEKLPHKCDLCDKRFQFPNKLKQHREKHLKKYKCEKCDEELETWTALKRHREKLHPIVPKMHQCSSCSYRTTSKPILSRHMETHQETRDVFICTIPGCEE